MKVLVVKMSSLGDVVHTLPAITDMVAARPGITVDWVVEEGFSAIPAMHPGVNRVIPVAIRRWRRSPFGLMRELPAFVSELRRENYDLVIDPQGLIKSALVVRLARGEKVGYDKSTAREPLASRAYNRKIRVSRDYHAIEKIRRLCARALEYPIPTSIPDYGLAGPGEPDRQVMFLHGTTWPSKHWPEVFWTGLTKIAIENGYDVLLPHGNDEELARVERIVAEVPQASILPRTGITELAEHMRASGGVVAVDSGLGHLAAAVAVPMVGLYGPTDPRLTGPISREQRTIVSDHLPCIPCLEKKCKLAPMLPENDPKPPCFAPLTPERVWQALLGQMGQADP